MGASLVRPLREPHLRQYESAGVDTLHLTFRAGIGLEISALAGQIEALLDALDAPAGVRARPRGMHGFENGVTYVAGITLDWTPSCGEGPNKGYASIQLKGDFFERLGSEEASFAFVWLYESQPYRCTRIDLQQTNCCTPLVPEIIRDYRAGRLRTRQKRFFEPKGLELANGHYPKGATLAHGTRSSDNYARQYDKHLQLLEVGKDRDPGPPRRRDEVEIKGALAQVVWTDLIQAITVDSNQPVPTWTAEARFAQGSIRHLLPIRDTSQWEGRDLPTNWASTAPEPSWWAELFSEEAVRARRARGPSRPFLGALEYPRKTFGGRYLQDLVLTVLNSITEGVSPDHAMQYATCKVRDAYVANATDARLDELLENLPEHQHELARQVWWTAVRQAADADDRERFMAESEKPRM